MVVVGAHEQRAGRQVVAGEPALGEPAVPLRAPGQVDDVVVALRLTQPLGPLLQERVGVGGTEEPLPAVGVEVVQSVRDVGQDAVDVEHRERQFAHPNSFTGLMMSAIEEQPAERDEDQGHHVGHRHQLRHVHRAGIGPPETAAPRSLDRLPDRREDLAAVQRRDGQQVEQEQRDVHRGQQLQEERTARRRRRVRARISPPMREAPTMPIGPVQVALLAEEHRAEQARHPLRQLRRSPGRCARSMSPICDDDRADALLLVDVTGLSAEEARPDGLRSGRSSDGRLVVISVGVSVTRCPPRSTDDRRRCRWRPGWRRCSALPVRSGPNAAPLNATIRSPGRKPAAAAGAWAAPGRALVGSARPWRARRTR